MDDVFGDGQRLGAADQERQNVIFRRLGLFNDSKDIDDRKSDEESHNEKHD
jgi:hypothetical protein